MSRCDFLHLLYGYIAGLFCLSSCTSTTENNHQVDGNTSNDPCSDLTGVPIADQEARKGLGYVAQSPQESQKCDNCKHWLPSESDSPCGNCLLFKGPVHPQGYCTYWEIADAS